MSEKKTKMAVAFKLLSAFAAGFLLWKYFVTGLEIITLRYGIDLSWAVVLSRFALLGYLLPFIIWYFLEPHKVCDFRPGDTHANIRMPFIWYGIHDNVSRVCVVFSVLCIVLAGIFIYVNPISTSVILAGVAFSIVNSILEEFLWRGLILSRTIQLCGEKLGLILMSLAFGFYHYPFGFSIPICLLFSLGGIYFGGITIRSKGLLLGTAMHISMNLLFVSIGIIFR